MLPKTRIKKQISNDWHQNLLPFHYVLSFYFYFDPLPIKISVFAGFVLHLYILLVLFGCCHKTKTYFGLWLLISFSDALFYCLDFGEIFFNFFKNNSSIWYTFGTLISFIKHSFIHSQIKHIIMYILVTYMCFIYHPRSFSLYTLLFLLLP